MKTGLAVGEVMTRKPLSVPPNVLIRECAKLMAAKDIGSLLIMENDELLGIVTEYDMVQKVVAESVDPDGTAVEKVMSTDLLTVSPAKDVYDAILLMRDNDIRHLPVIEDGKMLGFLTLKDVLKVEPQLFELMLDAIDLREEERKLALRPELRQEGFCEICGNFTDRLVPTKDRRMSCPACRGD